MMSDSSEDEEWDSVVESTCKVVNNKAAHGLAYDLTIAKTLNVAGNYQVFTIEKVSKRKNPNNMCHN